MTKLISIIALTSLISMGALAQTYKVNNDQSELNVLGTSTLHDWEIEAEEVGGKAVISTAEKIDISSLNFNVKVEGLKSGKSGMDKNTYEALESEDHPQVKYVLKEVKSVSGSGPTYKLETSGTLTIAGHSRTISLPVTAKVSGNTVKFSGKITFKMTDYQVDPPTALMGTIKTGDEITVDFNIAYNK